MAQVQWVVAFFVTLMALLFADDGRWITDWLATWP